MSINHCICPNIRWVCESCGAPSDCEIQGCCPDEGCWMPDPNGPHCPGIDGTETPSREV